MGATGGNTMVISMEDVCWLREAALKRGTHTMPAAIARKLIGAQLVRADADQVCMRLTKRGEIALARLG